MFVRCKWYTYIMHMYTYIFYTIFYHMILYYSTILSTCTSTSPRALGLSSKRFTVFFASPEWDHQMIHLWEWSNLPYVSATLHLYIYIYMYTYINVHVDKIYYNIGSNYSFWGLSDYLNKFLNMTESITQMEYHRFHSPFFQTYNFHIHS